MMGAKAFSYRDDWLDFRINYMTVLMRHSFMLGFKDANCPRNC